MDRKTYEEIITLRNKMHQEINAIIDRTEKELERLEQKKNAKRLLYEI